MMKMIPVEELVMAYKIGYYQDQPFTGCTFDKVDNTIFYYNDGKWDRKDGPALEWGDGTNHYYVDNKLHRDDGPAIEHIDGRCEFWLNGIYYDRLDVWAKAAGIYDTEQFVLLKLKYGEADGHTSWTI